jgi:hypothetical protein
MVYVTGQKHSLTFGLTMGNKVSNPRINHSDSAGPPNNPGSAALSLTWSGPVSGGLIAIDDECNRDVTTPSGRHLTR